MNGEGILLARVIPPGLRQCRVVYACFVGSHLQVKISLVLHSPTMLSQLI
jgi:hypothetical protein